MRRASLAPLVLIALVGCGNELPVVELSLPAAGPFYSDLDIDVQARVNDENHPYEELIVSWTSSIDGEVEGPTTVGSDGAFEGAVRLSPGNHVLSLDVQDPREDVGGAQVAVLVHETNTAPQCDFITPDQLAVTPLGDNTAIEVRVGDDELGAEGLVLSLASDRDGDLGAVSASADGFASVSATLTGGMHTLTLTATDELGLSCTATVEHPVNLPPTVAITSPETGFIEDVGEVVQLAGSVSDDLDGPYDLQVAWSSDVDGLLGETPASPVGELSLELSSLTRGPHTITLRVEDRNGGVSEGSVDILVNGPPTAPELSLTPEVPTTLDDLVVSVLTPSEDEEGDALTYTWAWTQDEVPVEDLGEAGVPADRTARDQTWTLTVTPNDGRLDGPSTVVSVGVVNTPPTLGSVTLSDTGPKTNDVLSVGIESSDVDEDTVTYSYAWSVNGVTSSVTTGTLDGSTDFDKGDTISVTVTPSDGDLEGTTVTSSVATVVNSAPSAPEVGMSPGWSRGNVDVSCVIDQDSVDADGDPVTYTITWDGDGTAYPSGFTGAEGPSTDALTDDTVPSEDQDLADTFTCSVVASDGTAAAPSVSASFDVATPYWVGNWREYPYTSILARNYLLGHPVVVPRDATVVELGLIAKRTTSNGRMALYTDSGGRPGTLVVGSSLQRVGVGSNTYSVTPTKLKAGTYWLMAVYDSTAYAGEDRGRHTVYYANMSAYSSFPTAPIWRSYSGYRHNYYMSVYE